MAVMAAPWDWGQQPVAGGGRWYRPAQGAGHAAALGQWVGGASDKRSARAQAAWPLFKWRPHVEEQTDRRRPPGPALCKYWDMPDPGGLLSVSSWASAIGGVCAIEELARATWN